MVASVKVRPGRFVHRVTLWRYGSTKDAMGQQIKTPAELGKAYASIDPISGRAYLQQSGEKAETTHRVTLRARTDFTLRARDTLTVGSRTFEINAVLDDLERGKLWTLLCREAGKTTS